MTDLSRYDGRTPEPPYPTETEPEEALIPFQWRPGAPVHPWDMEWFVAETTYGDRVVLVALPEDYHYDFKTADETHIMRNKIKRWAQFPDSQFIAAPLA